MTVVAIEARDVIERSEQRFCITGNTGIRLVKPSVDGVVPEKGQRCTKMIAAGVHLLSVNDSTVA